MNNRVYGAYESAVIPPKYSCKYYRQKYKNHPELSLATYKGPQKDYKK